MSPSRDGTRKEEGTMMGVPKKTRYHESQNLFTHEMRNNGEGGVTVPFDRDADA